MSFADTAKPFGAVAVSDRDREHELLAKIPVTEIAGIARRSDAKLEPFGIKTCLEFAKASGLLIRQILSVTGQDLWHELNGIPVNAIRPARSPHKNIARGGSLAGKVSDPLTLYGWLIRNVERLIEELHFHEVRPRSLTVYVSYFDADSVSAEIPLTIPTDRFDLLLEAAKVGLRAAWRPRCTATHMHLIASPGPSVRLAAEPFRPTRSQARRHRSREARGERAIRQVQAPLRRDALRQRFLRGPRQRIRRVRYSRQVLFLRVCTSTIAVNMTGIAMISIDVPTHLRGGLIDRAYARENREEYQFHWWQKPAILPVHWDGSFHLLTWGCKTRRSRLPYGGWLSREAVASGTIANARPEEVLIPANLGFHRGTWFMIDEGVRGVVLADVSGGPVVYILTEPSTNYYRNMTGQSPMMPALVNQVI